MMNEVLGLIDGVLNFEKEAKEALSKHESSVHRVITIEESYGKLTNLSLKQDDLMRQSLKCLESGIYRAAHVLSWAAMADYIEEWFALDNFVALLNVRPNWVPITSTEDLRENHSDFQLIEAFKKCRYIGKDLEKALKGLLAKRNECAHPSDYYPDINTTLGYISDILIRFEMLEKRKVKLFP